MVAEVFAPVAECVLFRLACGLAKEGKFSYRDYAAILLANLANLASFGVGELIHYFWYRSM